MIQRRTFLTGLAALITAPAIVRAGSLMPVRAMVEAELHLSGRSVWLMMQEAQREINFRRSLTIEYLRSNSFTPYDSLVKSLLSNARFLEAIDSKAI